MLRKSQNWGIILKKGLEFSKTHSPTRLKKKKKGREEDPQNYKQETAWNDKQGPYFFSLGGMNPTSQTSPCNEFNKNFLLEKKKRKRKWRRKDEEMFSIFLVEPLFITNENEQ